MKQRYHTPFSEKIFDRVVIDNNLKAILKQCNFQANCDTVIEILFSKGRFDTPFICYNKICVIEKRMEINR